MRASTAAAILAFYAQQGFSAPVQPGRRLSTSGPANLNWAAGCPLNGFCDAHDPALDPFLSEKREVQWEQVERDSLLNGGINPGFSLRCLDSSDLKCRYPTPHGLGFSKREAEAEADPVWLLAPGAFEAASGRLALHGVTNAVNNLIGNHHKREAEAEADPVWLLAPGAFEAASGRLALHGVTNAVNNLIGNHHKREVDDEAEQIWLLPPPATGAVSGRLAPSIGAINDLIGNQHKRDAAPEPPVLLPESFKALVAGLGLPDALSLVGNLGGRKDKNNMKPGALTEPLVLLPESLKALVAKIGLPDALSLVGNLGGRKDKDSMKPDASPERPVLLPESFKALVARIGLSDALSIITAGIKSKDKN